MAVLSCSDKYLWLCKPVYTEFSVILENVLCQLMICVLLGGTKLDSSVAFHLHILSQVRK